MGRSARREHSTARVTHPLSTSTCHSSAPPPLIGQGRAAWASIHDLLDRLADEALTSYDFVAEGELRRRVRERLHRKER